MVMLLDQVHWGGRVPLRQLHSYSRGALVTPAKAACGDVLASGKLLSQSMTWSVLQSSLPDLA